MMTSIVYVVWVVSVFLEWAGSPFEVDSFCVVRVRFVVLEEICLIYGKVNSNCIE